MSITKQELNMAKKVTGSFFSNRRKQLDLTQQELADKTGVRKTTVQRIEYGKFIPGGETLLSLILQLGLSLVFQSRNENESLTQLLKKTWTVSKSDKTAGSSGELISIDKAIAGSKIGSFFSDRRQQLGLTQAEVADRARLGLPTIQRIEYGRNLPDGKSLFKFCGALQCVIYPINFSGELLVFELTVK